MDKLRILILSFAFLILASPCAHGQEQVEWTEAVGRAPLDGGDCRKAALHDAFRNAVQEAVGLQVKGNTEVRNALLIRDKIIVKSDGYVKKYQVVDERKSGGEYEVKLKAQVSRTELNKDLFLNGIDVNQVYDWARKPRVMVLMTDLIDDKVSPTPFIGNEIEGLFKNKGITVIDSRQLKAIRERDVQLAYDDPRKAAALGNRFGAEIVIIGRSVSKFSRELEIAGFKQYFYSTELDAKAYRTSNAEVLMSQVYADDPEGEDTSAMGRHDAAVRSVRQVVGRNASDIVYRVVKSWYEGMTRANTYQLVVSRVKGSEVTALVKRLDELPDVVQVHRRSFNNGTAEIEIEFNGVQATLIESLEKNGVVPLALVSEEPFRFSMEKEK